jgi:hypothetical protein
MQANRVPATADLKDPLIAVISPQAEIDPRLAFVIKRWARLPEIPGGFDF